MSAPTKGRKLKYDYSKAEFEKILKKNWKGSFSATAYYLDMPLNSFYTTLIRLGISRDYCLSL